jgi:chemotaxis protein methyltransferase CheR
VADPQATWRAVQAYLRAACGVALADDQRYLLEARLGPLAAQHHFATTADFVAAACSDDRARGLGMLLVDAMTTHETFFFRDAAAWRTFEELIVPQVLAWGRRGLRIWSAACSNGQEPYSIAMLLEERWPEVAAQSTILATDVSAPAIERARAGLYSVLEVNRGLGAARLLRHFERSAAGGFQVKQSIRERVNWDVESVLHPTPRAPRFDVVFCRNVLIYFDDAERQTALERIARSSEPLGFLSLGVSERGPGAGVGPGWYRPGVAGAP